MRGGATSNSLGNPGYRRKSQAKDESSKLRGKGGMAGLLAVPAKIVTQLGSGRIAGKHVFPAIQSLPSCGAQKQPFARACSIKDSQKLITQKHHRALQYTIHRYAYTIYTHRYGGMFLLELVPPGLQTRGSASINNNWPTCNSYQPAARTPPAVLRD